MVTQLLHLRAQARNKRSTWMRTCSVISRHAGRLSSPQSTTLASPKTWSNLSSLSFLTTSKLIWLSQRLVSLRYTCFLNNAVHRWTSTSLKCSRSLSGYSIPLPLKNLTRPSSPRLSNEKQENSLIRRRRYWETRISWWVSHALMMHLRHHLKTKSKWCVTRQYWVCLPQVTFARWPFQSGCMR